MPSTGSGQNPVTKTTIETGEEIINGTKVVFRIEYAEPGSPLDKLLADEQTKALLALVNDVAARRARRGSIAEPAMDPIATTNSPTAPRPD